MFFEGRIKTEKNKKHIDIWINNWNKLINKNLLFLKDTFKKKAVDDWTDQELVVFLSKQNKLMISHWSKGALIELSDPEGDRILNDLLKAYNLHLSLQEISYLTNQERPTFVQQEFLDRMKLVKMLKAGINIDKKVKLHTKNYHWYRNTWINVYEHDYKYFFNLIKQDLVNFDKRIKEEKEIKLCLQQIKINRSKIYRRYKIPKEVKNTIYMFSRMTDWRDYRKKLTVGISNGYLYKIVKRLSVENNLSEDLTKLLTFEDLSGWKISKKLKSELHNRWNGSVYICDKNKSCRWLYKKEAKILISALSKINNVKVLKGVIASPGLVKGEVKIIETKEEFKKMKLGNILVTSMTRPEFLPLMKMSAGIITAEGGITCHAAVVSRELGKPCIINVQGVASVLKDGDMVELNANKGVIRKI
ncbi:MAG: PEP-utilizing enzyme [Candidatus Magasanikbacteria bacterium]